MSQSRRRPTSSKQRQEWRTENMQLTREISDLEDTLILHQRLTADDATSLCGILRNEIGGSRWQYGGKGKLHTFRSKQDLASAYGLTTPGHPKQDLASTYGLTTPGHPKQDVASAYGLTTPGHPKKGKAKSARSRAQIESSRGETSEQQGLDQKAVCDSSQSVVLAAKRSSSSKPQAKSGGQNHKGSQVTVTTKQNTLSHANQDTKDRATYLISDLHTPHDPAGHDLLSHWESEGQGLYDDLEEEEESYVYEREYSVEQRSLDFSLYAGADSLDVHDLKTKVLRKAGAVLFTRHRSGVTSRGSTNGRTKSQKTCKAKAPKGGQKMIKGAISRRRSSGEETALVKGNDPCSLLGMLSGGGGDKLKSCSEELSTGHVHPPSALSQKRKGSIGGSPATTARADSVSVPTDSLPAKPDKAFKKTADSVSVPTDSLPAKPDNASKKTADSISVSTDSLPAKTDKAFKKTGIVSERTDMLSSETIDEVPNRINRAFERTERLSVSHVSNTSSVDRALGTGDSDSSRQESMWTGEMYSDLELKEVCAEWGGTDAISDPCASTHGCLHPTSSHSSTGYSPAGGCGSEARHSSGSTEEWERTESGVPKNGWVYDTTVGAVKAAHTPDVGTAQSDHQHNPPTRSSASERKSGQGRVMSDFISSNLHAPDKRAAECDSAVAVWLAGLGLKDMALYQALFAQHEIGMEDLPSLTVSMLQQMGISSLGAVVKIVRGIEALEAEQQEGMWVNRPSPDGQTVEAGDGRREEGDVHSTVTGQVGRDQVFGSQVGAGFRQRQFGDMREPTRLSVERDVMQAGEYLTASHLSSQSSQSGQESIHNSIHQPSMPHTIGNPFVADISNPFVAVADSVLYSTVAKVPANDGLDLYDINLDTVTPTPALSDETHGLNPIQDGSVGQRSKASVDEVDILPSWKSAGANSASSKGRKSSSRGKGQSRQGQSGTARSKPDPGVALAALRRDQRRQLQQEAAAITRRQEQRLREKRDAMAARHKLRERSCSVDRDLSPLLPQHKSLRLASRGGRRRLSDGDIAVRASDSSDDLTQGDGEEEDVEEALSPSDTDRGQHQEDDTLVLHGTHTVRASSDRDTKIFGAKPVSSHGRHADFDGTKQMDGKMLVLHGTAHSISARDAKGCVHSNVDQKVGGSAVQAGFHGEGESVLGPREQGASDRRTVRPASSGVLGVGKNRHDLVRRTKVRGPQRPGTAGVKGLRQAGQSVGNLEVSATPVFSKRTKTKSQVSGRASWREPAHKELACLAHTAVEKSLTREQKSLEAQVNSHTHRTGKTDTDWGPAATGDMEHAGVALTSAGDTDKTLPSAAHLSMTKRQLLDEIRREKDEHRRTVRHLKSELTRLQHTDPVRKSEVERADISFRDSDLIGEGAFSQVFRGEYQGSEVAVKRLKAPLSSYDRNYFAAEVSLLHDLRHPRVVLLIGVSCADRLPLMVLEYMAGGDLYTLIHNPRRCSLDHAEFYQIARDVSSGMVYLHSHRPPVLHLDLKSMNVLLTATHRAKIADFGFSKLKHDADRKMRKPSKNKEVKGSPAWMAPELLSGGEVTSKADVYSFGVILWEMLTRKHPYEGNSVFQILESVRLGKRPAIPNSCPSDLVRLITQCWDPNPAGRPPFRVVLKQVEEMSFPPDWRALFQAAGVPHDALDDVTSTRRIISLVTASLESSTLGLLPDSARERQSDAGGQSESHPSRDSIPHSQREPVTSAVPNSVPHSQREPVTSAVPNSAPHSQRGAGGGTSSRGHRSSVQEKSPRDSLDDSDLTLSDTFTTEDDSAALEDSLDTTMLTDSLEEVSPRPRTAGQRTRPGYTGSSQVIAGSWALHSEKNIDASSAHATTTSHVTSMPRLGCGGELGGDGSGGRGTSDKGNSLPAGITHPTACIGRSLGTSNSESHPADHSMVKDTGSSHAGSVGQVNASLLAAASPQTSPIASVRQTEKGSSPRPVTQAGGSTAKLDTKSSAWRTWVCKDCLRTGTQQAGVENRPVSGQDSPRVGSQAAGDDVMNSDTGGSGAVGVQQTKICTPGMSHGQDAGQGMRNVGTQETRDASVQEPRDSPRLSARQARRLGVSRRSVTTSSQQALPMSVKENDVRDVHQSGDGVCVTGEDKKPQVDGGPRDTNTNNNSHIVLPHQVTEENARRQSDNCDEDDAGQEDYDEDHQTREQNNRARTPTQGERESSKPVNSAPLASPTPRHSQPSGPPHVPVDHLTHHRQPMTSVPQAPPPPPPLLLSNPQFSAQPPAHHTRTLASVHQELLRVTSTLTPATSSPRRSATKKRVLKERFRGNPHISVEASALQEQRGQLRSAATPHPNQLRAVPQDTQVFTSIADLLRKAMCDRRFAMGENQIPVATSQEMSEVSWSLTD